MSYPPYQQAPGDNQAPYPQHGGMPGAPYPVFPPSIGMPMNSPMYMPQPYAGMHAGAAYPSYPQYPPTGQYPPPGSGYGPPPTDGGYAPPSSDGGYAPPPHSGGEYAPPRHSGGGYAPPPHSGGGYAPPGGVPVYPGVGSNAGALQATKTYTPTLHPASPFDPRADAEILRKAMKGFGTDEKAIISVLGHRTNAQRLQISQQFKTLYGKDLVKDLKSETSGKFEQLIVALMTPLPVFFAHELHHAISGMGTNEETLIEIMCSMNNDEIRCIVSAYQSSYFHSLEDDLIGDTSGTFRRLMVSLCTAGRDESPHVNQGQVQADAQSLLAAGVQRWGTDESTFNMIMCQRSYAHLKCVFDEYSRLAQHDIEQAVKGEFSGNSEQAMLAIIRCVRNRPGFFAKMLNCSVKGMGTNDRQLIRLVATRCEVDMEDVKRDYIAKYGESLHDAISGDTSGHYKKLLLCLIGEYN